MRSSSRITIARLLCAGLLLVGLLFAPSVRASQVVLAWDPSPSPEVTGYLIHYGTTNGTYSQTLNAGNLTTAAVSNLTEGVTYFFAVTAYSTPQVESDLSNEVSTLAKLRLRATQSTNQFQISLDSSVGRRYFFERNDNIPAGVWTVVATNLLGTGASLQITEPFVMNSTARVYRATSTP